MFLHGSASGHSAAAQSTSERKLPAGIRLNFQVQHSRLEKHYALESTISHREEDLDEIVYLAIKCD